MTLHVFISRKYSFSLPFIISSLFFRLLFVVFTFISYLLLIYIHESIIAWVLVQYVVWVLAATRTGIFREIQDVNIYKNLHWLRPPKGVLSSSQGHRAHCVSYWFSILTSSFPILTFFVGFLLRNKRKDKSTFYFNKKYGFLNVESYFWSYYVCMQILYFLNQYKLGTPPCVRHCTSQNLHHYFLLA